MEGLAATPQRPPLQARPMALAMVSLVQWHRPPRARPMALAMVSLSLIVPPGVLAIADEVME
jgi:hypothetical protein